MFPKIWRDIKPVIDAFLSSGRDLPNATKIDSGPQQPNTSTVDKIVEEVAQVIQTSGRAMVYSPHSTSTKTYG